MVVCLPKQMTFNFVFTIYYSTSRLLKYIFQRDHQIKCLNWVYIANVRGLYRDIRMNDTLSVIEGVNY